MTFDRQLDLIVAFAASLQVFVGCIFYLAIPVSFAAIIAGVVLILGLLIGRDIIEIARAILGL